MTARRRSAGGPISFGSRRAARRGAATNSGTPRAEIEGEGDDTPFDPFEPPIDEPPEVAFQHGVPVGMPGERIAEQGVLDDRLIDLLPGRRATPDD